jgi:hypothetical protein
LTNRREELNKRKAEKKSEIKEIIWQELREKETEGCGYI